MKIVVLDGYGLKMCIRDRAYRKLQYWIDYYPHLREQLEKMGSGLSCRTYMPVSYTHLDVYKRQVTVCNFSE